MNFNNTLFVDFIIFSYNQVVIIVTRVLLIGRESIPVERGSKSEVGSISRSVFSYIKISSHHIHKWWEKENNFLEVQSKALFSPLPSYSTPLIKI